MEDVMKRLFCLRSLILSLLSFTTYINCNVYNDIHQAIEKSMPQYLRKCLSKVNLSPSQKEDYLSLAKAKKKIREEKVKLDKIKPKTSEAESYAWATLGTFGFGAVNATLTGAFLFYKDLKQASECGVIALGSLVLSWYCYQCLKGARGKIFRTRQQKYVDSVRIQTILENIV